MRTTMIPNAPHSFRSLQQLRDFVGQPEVAGAPIVVTQDLIDAYAEISGDHQWIHVDVERSRRESRFGSTIAHGMLTLMLVNRWYHQCFEFPGRKFALNYGYNKIRFVTPVPVGSRLVGRFRLQSVQDVGVDEVRCTWLVTMQGDGNERPATVVEWLTQMKF